MLNELEKVAKALADKNRIRIVKMLQCRAMCVCEIREVLGLAQPSVSKHLKILKDAGVIKASKEGLWTNYQLDPQNGYAFSLCRLIKSWLPQDRQIQHDFKKARTSDRGNLCGSGTGKGR